MMLKWFYCTNDEKRQTLKQNTAWKYAFQSFLKSYYLSSFIFQLKRLSLTVNLAPKRFCLFSFGVPGWNGENPYPWCKKSSEPPPSPEQKMCSLVPSWWKKNNYDSYTFQPSEVSKTHSANLEPLNLDKDLMIFLFLAPEQQGMCHHTSSRTLARPVVFGQKSRWQIQ